MSKPACQVQWLGVVPYQDAWEYQAKLAGEIAAGSRPPTLLLLEHPHTFTFGRRGQAAHLLWDEQELARRQAAVYWVDRGGDVTYHGPGQLVGYPLLPLQGLEQQVLQNIPTAQLPRANHVGYLRNLERLLVETLAVFGVMGYVLPGLTGVWVKTRETEPVGGSQSNTMTGAEKNMAKIAAIGVKVDARGITRHGFALNVKPDMSYWGGIVACGLADCAVTSLAEVVSPPPSMEALCAALLSAFQNVFEYNTQWIDQPFKFPEEKPF